MGNVTGFEAPLPWQTTYFQFASLGRAALEYDNIINECAKAQGTLPIVNNASDLKFFYGEDTVEDRTTGFRESVGDQCQDIRFVSSHVSAQRPPAIQSLLLRGQELPGPEL